MGSVELRLWIGVEFVGSLVNLAPNSVRDFNVRDNSIDAELVLYKARDMQSARRSIMLKQRRT